METNENLFRNIIKLDVFKLNLIEKAQQSILYYFKEWPRNELDDYLGENFNLNKIDTYVKLLKYGVEIIAHKALIGVNFSSLNNFSEYDEGQKLWYMGTNIIIKLQLS